MTARFFKISHQEFIAIDAIARVMDTGSAAMVTTFDGHTTHIYGTQRDQLMALVNSASVNAERKMVFDDL